MPQRLPRAILLSWACLAAISCGSTSVDPPDDDPEDIPATMMNIAGAYTATSFVGGGFDVLALGGSLNISLGADGSLAGNMFIPAAAGGPLDADMVGTYTLSGSSLTFLQDADTFIRDSTWIWSNGVLNGSWSGAGQGASVRLERGI